MKTLNQSIGNYDDPEKAKNYFAAVKGGSEVFGAGVDANVFRYLKNILPINLSSLKVLDIGCGDARWSEYFSKSGAEEVFAIDKSPAMIALAKKRIKEEKLNKVHVILGDMENLPIENSSIDIAFSSFSLMYFANLEYIIAEIVRTIKHGGILFIATNIFFSRYGGKLVKKLKEQNVPVELGFGKKMQLENLVQPLEQYKQSLKAARLVIEECEYFEPEGVQIENSYEYKNDLMLRKVVFVARKK